MKIKHFCLTVEVEREKSDPSVSITIVTVQYFLRAQALEGIHEALCPYSEEHVMLTDALNHS